MNSITFLIAKLNLAALIILMLGSCGSSEAGKNNDNNTGTQQSLFRLVESKSSGIDFKNTVVEDQVFNVITNEYNYNGAGVGVGDINNDGLSDIYFTGNTSSNKLYLNKGDLKFEDITEKAGVAAAESWCTGVTMVDINADGLLDIYVCRSLSNFNTEKRKNLLFINNGDLTFSEKAADYGLNYDGYSTQSVFFDYDNDGDLDMYLGNHPNSFDIIGRERIDKRDNPNLVESDHFFKNNGDGTFLDVTEEAGITNYGFALSVNAADLNGDGLTDIFVANDYIETDFLYINNGDGTFSNNVEKAFMHMSNFSMGSDVADFNNDGLLDILTVDMMAEDNYRQKSNMSAMNPEQFWYFIGAGYQFQYMRNMLHMNNGNGTYSEVGQMAGIPWTDWSWTAFFADLDNDGMKDIYITNGLKRDVKNVDAKKQREKKYGNLKTEEEIKSNYNVLEMLEEIPSVRLQNYLFQNTGGFKFEKMTDQWGMPEKSFSNGAAFADFDNDGDLDMVVNNMDDPAFLYENRASENGNNYLRITCKGSSTNPSGIGAQVTLKTSEGIQFQRLSPTRGYLSSVEPNLHFGLGKVSKVNELVIVWPDGKEESIENVASGQKLVLDYANAVAVARNNVQEQPVLFSDATEASGVTFRHIENDYNDFETEVLLPHKTSQFGPGLAVGDANGDGREDFFVGGAHKQGGSLYLQNADGSFARSSSGPWEADRNSEDMGAAFFDADGDGDQDLVVTSGGNEFTKKSLLESFLSDRIYMNDGKGNFEVGRLPRLSTSSSCVKPFDIDADGDLDLFIGGRLVPGKYPFPAQSYILENDGNGKFRNVTGKVAPDLTNLGMVTDAVWSDYDGDGKKDLLLTGEWMPLTVFHNEGGTLAKLDGATSGLGETTGWWWTLSEADVDGDGDMDYIAGNLGENYKYSATPEEPFHVYCDDFDKNGSFDIVLGYYNGGTCFPVRGRQCSSEQMPFIKDKFENYHEYASSTLEDVYGKESLDKALHYTAKEFRNCVVINDGGGKFTVKPLPPMAQIAPVNGVIAKDFSGDGKVDLLLAGNLYASEVETGRADAGMGLYLEGDGSGSFVAKKISESGFFVPGDVKGLALIETAMGTLILAAKNNDKMQVMRFNQNGIDNSLSSR